MPTYTTNFTTAGVTGGWGRRWIPIETGTTAATNYVVRMWPTSGSSREWFLRPELSSYIGELLFGEECVDVDEAAYSKLMGFSPDK